MKNPKWNWRDFWYGFIGALVVLLSVVFCLWGIHVAEKNTKAIGFTQSMAFGLLPPFNGWLSGG